MTRLQKVITFPSHAKKFRMCIHEKHDVVNASERNPGASPGFGGFEGSMVQTIIDNIGVEFDYYVPDGDGYGVRFENGSWTGCPGMMQRNETDVAMAGMFLNPYTYLSAQPSISYRTEKVRFISKLPDPVTKPEVIMEIFDTDLWITIFTFIFIIAFVSYWVHGKQYSFLDHCFSRLVELLMQEPSVKIEKKCSQELLCLFWNIGALFLTLSYMAVLRGVLMTPKHPPIYNTDDKPLDVVITGKHMAATGLDRKMSLENLRQSPLPKFQELGNIILEKNLILEINRDTLTPLLKNGYALASSVVSRKLHGVYDIERYASEYFVYQANLCSLLSKNFPFKKKFNGIMTRMVEHGLYEREFELFIFKSRLKHKQITEAEKKSAWALTLDDLQAAFIIYGTGFIISTSILIYELAKFHLNKRRNKKCIHENG